MYPQGLLLQALLETNLRLLAQGLELLERLDESIYPDRRVGAQFRHILDFYECFTGGLTCGRIDYNARRRDEAVEKRRSEGIARLRALSVRLARYSLPADDSVLLVRPEDMEELAVSDQWIASSAARELQFLLSHTTHHYALIGFALQAIGVPVDPDFGVAPSTLLYRKSQQERKAVPCAL